MSIISTMPYSETVTAANTVQSAETDETVAVFRIANNHASILCSSAVLDDEGDRQLVAASLIAEHGAGEVLKSIYATLFTNANNNGFSFTPDRKHGRSIWLSGAKRSGWAKVKGQLARMRIKGSTLSVLHPLALDPRNSETAFYVVASSDMDSDKVFALFAERLGIAIEWPVLTSWVSHLITAGEQESLVTSLPVFGPEWKTGYRVARDSSAWINLISAGLADGSLHWPEEQEASNGSL